VSAITRHPTPTTGEFQEVVDAKLRHTHPRVQKQRAAAASLASTVASASALQSMDISSQPPSDSEGIPQQQQQQLVGSSSTAADLQAAAAAAGAAAAAAVNEGIGIQVVHVVPWQDPSSSSSSKSADDDEVLLEMDHVSINTPDGGLALVQDLSLKVHSGECVRCLLCALRICTHGVEPWGWLYVVTLYDQAGSRDDAVMHRGRRCMSVSKNRRLPLSNQDYNTLHLLFAYRLTMCRVLFQE
jgi:hypothetical protein